MISVSNRVAVMEGALTGLSLADILQVVGIGRQFTGVELRAEDQSRAGTIFVKSGKVVWADTQGFQGKEAFFRLFQTPSKSFHVFRSELPEALPEPIGTVPSLLAELSSFEQAARAGLPALMTRARSARIPLTALSGQATAHGSAAATPPPATVSSAETLSPETVVTPPPAREAAAAAAPHEATPDRARGTTGRTTLLGPTLAPVVPAPSPSAASASVGSARGESEAWRRPPDILVGRAVAPAPSAPAAVRRIVAVSGPKGGTGKTTVSLNLAVSLARQGFRVALVDGSTHGDIVMATDGGAKARAGVFDVLAGRASLDEALLSTSLRGLSVMYAVGPTLPEPEVLQGDHRAAWKAVLGQVAARFDVVLVDTPGGMLGATQQILGAASHVLGVLQAEVLSQRSMTMFRYALEALPLDQRPDVLGILINMVQVRHGISLDVLKELGESLPATWLLETTLPRNPAFLDATRAGLPLRLVDHQHPPSVAWLFDALASEVIERLRLVPADAPRASQPLFSSS